MVGLTNARSIQDEKIVESIFSSHRAPESRVSQPVFGATSTNLIIDARPTTNAVANTAKGAGTENMDHYKECKKAYLGIDNIHTMRDSLNKVIEALGESEALAASVSGDLPGTNVAVVPVDRQALRRSGWLRHQMAILEGTLIIVRNVHVNHSHVLIHCSDGWDRTSQLSAVSQLCLDPYYRTTRGFQVLIEKDFVSFGHRFLDRCGHLSSEKFFLAPVDGGGGADVQALFASVQNRFAGNHHIKETSPVFHQFLEAVHNIQRQFPTRFEFNELLLRDLHTHLYSCQFGTFLFNSERERREGAADTVPVWDYINSDPQTEKYINPDYNPALDDPTSRAPNADQGVLFPNPKDVRFWHELYGRSDEEMNGRFTVVPAPLPAFTSGLAESIEDDLSLPDVSISLSQSGPPSRGTSSPPPVLLSSSPAPAPTPVISPVPVRVPSPLTSPGPRPMRPPPTTDLFGSASGGMRSMWDRLSSGAGAAFSAVQDAYGTGTTARDTSRTRSSSALPASGELQDWGASPSPFSRFDPPRVAQAVRPSTFSGSSGPAGAGSGSANPWAVAVSTSPRGADEDGMPSVLVDNPWNTTRRAAASRSLPDPFVVDELAATLPRAAAADRAPSSLPADPSVALPVPVKPAVVSTPHLHTADPGDAPVLSSTGSVSEAPKLPAVSASSSTAEDMDPLGVGMW